MCSTTSGTRSVMSCSERLYTRTSAPSLWACIRAPSSFTSNAASPSTSIALAASSVGEASMGSTGRNGASW
jgi:hypothetical protein